ncbi:hypothetical protein ACLOJK_027880 [Asimina triloba]
MARIKLNSPRIRVACFQPITVVIHSTPLVHFTGYKFRFLLLPPTNFAHFAPVIHSTPLVEEMSETVEGEAASAMATEDPAAAAAEASEPEKEEEPKTEKASEEQQGEEPRRKKAPREKKPIEKNPVHPPYFQMIKEAILALQDKSGSSTYAIAKYVEQKHQSVLPANFKKMLALQLKNFTAKGKLIKIRASFKLSELGKKDMPVKTIDAAGKKPKPVPKPTTSSTKTRAGKKAAASAAKKKRRGGRKSGKSATPKTKQPISIKSPAAKKTKKVAAV